MLVDRLSAAFSVRSLYGFIRQPTASSAASSGAMPVANSTGMFRVLGDARQVDPAALAGQPDVGQDQVDLLAVERRDRIGIAIVRRDDLIAGFLEHGFIVERRQRLVLDDQDTLDDPLGLPEQHITPVGRTQWTRNERSARQCRAASAATTERRKNPVGRGPAPPREDGPQRIAKLLARAGIASRRDIERMIEEGRIALDGKMLTPPRPCSTDLTGVTVDGKPVKPAEAARLFLFYKPPGTLTAARDPKGRPTIYDKLPPGLPRLMPVGRLDYMTEGLLLMTNDGEFKRQLELPSTGVVRTYRARAFGEITPGAAREPCPKASPSKACATARSTPISSAAPGAIAGSKCR